MADSRRRQLHSCDQCRKGKRGCDAPKDRKEMGFSSCSNCKRWKKECTFNFLSSKRASSKGERRRPKPTAAARPQIHDIPTTVNHHGTIPDEHLCSLQPYPAMAGDLFPSPESSNSASISFSHSEGAFTEDVPRNESGDGQCDLVFWSVDIPDNQQIWTVTPESGNALGRFESQFGFPDSVPNSLENMFETIQQFEDGSNPSFFNYTGPGSKQNGHEDPSAPEYSRRFRRRSQEAFCLASENTANEYARATMTRNLIRIYHDSMENALSCWLTEHNCPYRSSITTVLPPGERIEWGPNWSNRMCIRVCRLDRASSLIRGRALSAEEDKTAARALYLAIVAFASQWTQHAQKGTSLSVPAAVASDERSIREKVWNEARHALEHSTGIPSFRVAFANIIFSLAQSPLDVGKDLHLDQLLDGDRAPIFLENANRQLFTFRHKFARLKREAPLAVREVSNESTESAMTEVLELPKTPESPQVDPILTSHEHRDTLSLLFWLGVMFDTLSAAMYQRPLVVSDEDSQIPSASASTVDTENSIDLDSSDTPENEVHKKQDVWGDFFLRSPAKHHGFTEVLPRWPCSYEEAASVLSEATPVKVLLYRRVTQLQNLIYREASRSRLENFIQKTLRVYQHWNCRYQKFMLDCVTNHEMLPPRIQSWYVILDGHWHLAALLLADVIESIDRRRLGSDAGREARQAADLVFTLRVDNALAVGALARSSLQGKEPTMQHVFHDSLNEVAFLVEPWTVVLIHSFAKAGYICLENLHIPGEQDVLAKCFQQNCEFCISALEYLGRKSDMAFLVARNLSKSLELKLRQRV